MKYDLIIIKDVVIGTPPVSASVPVSVTHQNIDLNFAQKVYSSSIDRVIPPFWPNVVLTGSYQIGVPLS